MIIILDPKTLSKVIKKGMYGLDMLPYEKMEKTKVYVYRKGKDVCAKVVIP